LIRRANVERRPPNTVLARVNGRPILESDVAQGLPQNAFDITADTAHESKLVILVQQEAIRQFLDSKAITVSDDDVDRAVDAYRKTPPKMSCPCCRYSSLDQFLSANYLTLSQFRDQVRNDLRMKRYILGIWKERYPTQAARRKLVKDERQRLSTECARVWQVFFNTFQQPDFKTNPAKVKAEKRVLAYKAWNRIKRGEPFERVAREMSDDMISRDAGGALGVILKSSYGKDFENELAGLRAGKISAPFETIWGFHIIKWERVKDADLLAASQDRFIQNMKKQLARKILLDAKIVRCKQSA